MPRDHIRICQSGRMVHADNVVKQRSIRWVRTKFALAYSSVVERAVVTRDVRGSNPRMPANHASVVQPGRTAV